MQRPYDTPFLLALTGEGSHKVKISAGQGSFAIGTKNESVGKFDALVEAGAQIMWSTFDDFTTPAGSLWPRVFYYSGADCNFAKWSEHRRIETFNWSPNKDVTLDCSLAQIDTLTIHSSGNKVKLLLGEGVRTIQLSGDLAAFEISATRGDKSLLLSPELPKDKTKQYTIPQFPAFHDITSLSVSLSAAGQALDCASLLQFQNAVFLDLSGNATNLQCLAELTNLKSIGLRMMPNLENFPSLTTWPRLSSFIGYVVEEQQGKILQKEVKALQSEKEFDYVNVSKLKSKLWFETEYGLPFSGWEPKSEKLAVKAFKAALKHVSKAKSVEEIELGIRNFIVELNLLPNLETEERENAGEAVLILHKAFAVAIAEDVVLQWFDTYRDF